MHDTSFLPEEYLDRRLQRRTNVISLVLFVVVLGVVVSAYFVTDQQRAEVKSLQAQVNQQFEDAAKRLEQLDELQRRKDAMIRKAQVSAALIERVPRSVLLAEMINNMPATLSLVELDLTTKILQTAPRPKTAMEKARQAQHVEAASEPEVPVTEAPIYMIGLAPTDVEVAQFMTALGQSPMFRDVNLVYSEEAQIDERVMRRFRVEMMLNQHIDLKTLREHEDQTPNLNPMGGTFQIDVKGQLVFPEAEAGDGAPTP